MSQKEMGTFLVRKTKKEMAEGGGGLSATVETLSSYFKAESLM